MANEMIQQLPSDVLLEIITRLPLKYAVQCRTLNNYFYNNISLTKLLSSISIPPIIFHQSEKDQNHRLTILSSPLRESTTVPKKISILCSCNGTLLLYCGWPAKSKYCVFNPLTGGIKLLNCYINSWGCDGLATIVPSSSSSFDFKLVELHIGLPNKLKPFIRLWFLVYVPSPSNNNDNMEVKSFHLDYHGSLSTRRLGGVYAHGCVHWLGADAAAIAAFDVETERPMIMDGPLRNAPTKCFRSWFGLARGSLQFIKATMRNGIVVHSHNYATQEWCVARKIPIGEHIWGSFSVVRHGPMFFDGQNVFFHIGKQVLESIMEEIYVYDLSIGEWNMSEQVKEKGYNHCYREFVPTTARVSDVYLWSSKISISAELQSILVELQRLLLDHA